MNDLYFYFLIGMFGSDIANEIANKNRKIDIPILLLFSIIFTLTYNIGLFFFYLVYKIKGFPIPWSSLSLSCLYFAFLVSVIVFLLDKLKKRDN